MQFKDLNLNAHILQALLECKYEEPTDIQAAAIPIAMAGRDVIGTAQTGTGKTLAFVIPMLEQLLKTPERGKPRVLVLVPTRELADQVREAVLKYGKKFQRLQVVSILGGMPFHVQLRQLKRPVDIIVATPGRLIDHFERGTVDLSCIEMLVLDEADRMLDMGFIDDVEKIVRATPKSRQTLLFTATLDNRLQKLTGNILRDPQRIEIAGKKVTLDNIEQRVHIVDDEPHKNRLLQHLLSAENMYKAIVFSGTKRNADKLARQLYAQGLAVGALHGDMNQSQRNRMIKQFHDNHVQFLIATDVVARGIDVKGVSHVINYDMPKFAEDYVHRIGRTGRAGNTGVAISLVLSSDITHLKRIERFTAQKIPQSAVAGFEAKRTVMHDDNGSQPKKKWHGSKGGFKGRSDFRGGYSSGAKRSSGARAGAKSGGGRNGAQWR